MLFPRRNCEVKKEKYFMMDFSTVTACGECCTGCAKKQSGQCPGCIQADGVVPAWRESGRCKVHACTREHGVQFCGICPEFPCGGIMELIHWNSNILEHMMALADQYRQQIVEHMEY